MIAVENIDPRELPSLPITSPVRLPDRPGIYFAVDSAGVVLYVGKARRLAIRWLGSSHHRYNELVARGDVRIAWLTVEDESLLDGIEAACVAHFRPALNGTPTTAVTSRNATSGAPVETHLRVGFLAAARGWSVGRLAKMAGLDYAVAARLRSSATASG